MSNPVAALYVDVFSTKGVKGWVATFDEKTIVPCPLFVVLGADTFIDVDEFYFREDVKQSNFGTGVYGFSIDCPLSIGTCVEIYEKRTARKLWAGTVGKPHEQAVKVEITPGHGLLNAVTECESCLSLVGRDSVAALALRRNSGLYGYQLAMTVNGKDIFYFQTLHSDALAGDFEILIEGFHTTSREAGRAGNNILLEHFCVQEPASRKKTALPNIASLRFRGLSGGLSTQLSWEKLNRDWIFIFAHGNRFALRPNLKIDIPRDLTVPLIPPLFSLQGHFPAIVNKNSVIYVAHGNKVIWSPMRLSIPDLRPPYSGAQNIVTNLFIDSDLWSNRCDFDMEGLMHFYDRYGAPELAKALYIHLLQRDGDQDGVDAVVDDFNEHLKNAGQLGAIRAIWNRFVNSDEFRRRKFSVFRSKGLPGYPFEM